LPGLRSIAVASRPTRQGMRSRKGVVP